MSRVIREFDDAGTVRRVLDELDFTATGGSLVAITGPSGSGKSTLLHLLGGIDVPNSGRITVSNTDLTGLNETDRTLFRRRHIGLVFQFFNLIPTLSVIDNLRLPLELCGLESDDSVIMPWLERFHLQNQASCFPDLLSGGEQQRVAVIRATIHRPTLILADEPTGNLDESQGRIVLELVRTVADEGTCVIMATHSRSASECADRHYRLSDGKLHESSPD
ncbi:MAG: ABC transporter ATP-binding protein [Gammaproteobacteria bacterium]|nr:ABC transporter ATP-binding protein [Gammaproteobacteria bacterium]MYD76274.1 ABC transporter ATP-binding protein [Gammaproteobacteria bacterium]MYJ51312.1 ABC transporter ATP-binding protein [Gammaproteobacteria bacterium]